MATSTGASSAPNHRTDTAPRDTPQPRQSQQHPENRFRRLTTETKASFKTTEFFAFVAVVAGILIAAAIIDEANAGGMGAKQAWLYVSIVTAGYMVSRGLAKSGSSQPYDEDNR